MLHDTEENPVARVRDVMEPMPERAVAVLADLGLEAHEIARYFGVPLARVNRILGAAAGNRNGPGAPPAAPPPCAMIGGWAGGGR